MYIDWMQITWNEWVIGYDFAHQLALAQNLQRGSKNWGESARAWFDRKQQEGKRWLKSWQLSHGSLGYLLPVALVLLLLALRYNVPAEVIRRVRLILRIRAAKSGRSDPQLASRLYAELLRMLAPFPAAGMKIYPVSSSVNQTDIDNPDLITRVDAGMTMSLF